MMWPLYQRLLPEQFTDWSEKRKMSRRRQSAARPRQPHLSRYRCALPRSNGIMCIWIAGLPLSVRFVSAKLQNCELLPSVRITACTKATCTNIEEHIYVISFSCRLKLQPVNLVFRSKQLTVSWLQMLMNSLLSILTYGSMMRTLRMRSRKC